MSGMGITKSMHFPENAHTPHADLALDVDVDAQRHDQDLAMATLQAAQERFACDLKVG